MNVQLSAITNYIPPIWNMPEDTEDLLEFVEGDLVEFDDYYNEYIGCGIIKRITISEFKNPVTGEFEMLPCAVIVSANPDKQFLDYVPLHLIDPLNLSDYISIWKAEYDPNLSPVQECVLQLRVIAIMQKYSPVYRDSYRDSHMPSVWNNNAPVQLPATGGAQ